MSFSKPLFLGLATLSLLSWSGCSLDEQGLDLDSQVNVDECEASGSTACVQDENSAQLELVIQSPNPIEALSTFGDCDGSLKGTTKTITDAGDLATSNVYCFDISGECNEGNNEFASLILKSNTFSPASNIVSNPTVLTRCQRGRFHTQLRVNLAPVDLCKRHSLELELIGKKLNGDEETNPSKARKFIDVLAKNRLDCPP